MSSKEHPEKPKPPYSVEEVQNLGSAGIFGEQPGVPLAKTQESPLAAYQSTETTGYFLVIGRVENFDEAEAAKPSNWVATRNGDNDFTIQYIGTFKNSVAASDFQFKISVEKEYWPGPGATCVAGVDLNKTKGDDFGQDPVRKTKVILTSTI